MDSQAMENPMVSVFMITYNHEPYIAQAIEGVLNQKTDFGIELVLGEDCSTDDTAEICRRYASKYPEIISLITEPINLGPFKNGVKTLGRCNGKYIALCEGDDYWTDSKKLQKQIDLLEENQNASFCFTKANVLFETDREFHRYLEMNDYPSVIALEDYLNHYYPIPHLTKVWRASSNPDFEEKKWKELTSKVKYLDNALHFYHLIQGPALFIPEITGTYRVQATSITRQSPQNDEWHIREILNTHDYFLDLVTPELQEKIKSIRAFHYRKLFDLNIATKQYFLLWKDVMTFIADRKSGSITSKLDLIVRIFRKHLIATRR